MAEYGEQRGGNQYIPEASTRNLSHVLYKNIPEPLKVAEPGFAILFGMAATLGLLQ